MTINTSLQNGVTIVQINGRIDTITAAEFEKSMKELLAAGVSELILDCSQLEYISSTGLRVFLILQKSLKPPQGNLKLCSLPPSIKEVFEISGFSRIFSIEENTASALQHN